MKIVHEVDVSESGLDMSLQSCLSPLLHDEDISGLRDLFQETSKLIFNGPSITRNDESLKKKWGSSALVSSKDIPREATNEKSSGRNRESHLEKWSLRFQDLSEFRKTYGRCLVPLEWPQNPSLAHWVKRQRCQYKSKTEGRHSTLTEERQSALEELGFIWDSHKATWEERLNEIIDFKEFNGHANVPSNFPANPQLSVWVKCQRRQYKLFLENKKSNMTMERIDRLTGIGFDLTPRKRKQSSSDLSHLSSRGTTSR